MKLLASHVALLLGMAACRAPDVVPASSSTITVEVCCDPDKQLDANYRIQITVSDGDRETSVAVPVLVQSTGGACARAIQRALESKQVAASAPTAHHGPPFADGTAWDVTLPNGVVVKSIRVERTGAVASSELNGQLMIHAR